MGKNYKNAVHTHVRDFYGGNFNLKIGLFNKNLALRINPNRVTTFGGSSQNDMGDGITATVNFEGAYYLYEVAMSIVNDLDRENEKRAVLERGDTTTILEYIRNQNNIMVAYLTICKNNQSFSYEFLKRTYQEKNGQMITKFVQSELGAFAHTILGYLIGVGAGRHLEKLHDESQNDNQQGFNSIERNQQGYQQGSNSRYQQRNNNSGYQQGNNSFGRN